MAKQPIVIGNKDLWKLIHSVSTQTSRTITSAMRAGARGVILLITTEAFVDNYWVTVSHSSVYLPDQKLQATEGNLCWEIV